MRVRFNSMRLHARFIMKCSINLREQWSDSSNHSSRFTAMTGKFPLLRCFAHCSSSDVQRRKQIRWWERAQPMYAWCCAHIRLKRAHKHVHVYCAQTHAHTQYVCCRPLHRFSAKGIILCEMFGGVVNHSQSQFPHREELSGLNRNSLGKDAAAFSNKTSQN